MNNPIFEEVAQKVIQEFNFSRPSDFTDWNNLSENVDKKRMFQHAFTLLDEQGGSKSSLITVFDKLNIDISIAKGKGLRKHLYDLITEKTMATAVHMPRHVQIHEYEQVLVQEDVNYLESIDNSEYSKLNWFKQRCQAGRQNEKKTKEDTSRGGYFSWGPQSSRRDLEEHAIQFLSSNIKMPDICPVSKCKLDYGDSPVARGYDNSNQEHAKHRATLDRHDPTIGYTFENTFVVCEFANRNKGTMTIEDVERLLEYMYLREQQN